MDSSRLSTQSHYHLQYRNTVITYDRVVSHKKYGTVRRVIHRAVGNDSWLKQQMTREQLARYEPNVGMWPGDFMELFDENGQLLEQLTQGEVNGI
ncbi:MAG: hypothetical protein IPI73_30310 [Betaproteobacteria bacterium]|nr:hypothetical protein [Betaproteobacteria bacterium]